MISGSRKHRRYLDRLQHAAMADADFVRAVAALTPEDFDYLRDAGWNEPEHARFVRLNGLDVDTLPVPIR